MHRVVSVYFGLWLLTAAGSAAASPLFELVGGVGDQSGFGARASGAGGASAYFNPALLPRARVGLSTGYVLLNDQIGVSLDGRNGGDVPLEYRGATHANGTPFEQPSLPTSWLRQGCQIPNCSLALAARPRQALGSSNQTRSYESVALVVAIVPHKLVFGFYGLVPLAQFTTANSFFVDEREQFFTNSLHPELYSDRLTATSLAFALGAQLTRRLSIGVGVTLSLRNTANAQTFVGNADDIDRTLLLSTNVGVKVALAPHFGIAYDLGDRLHLTGTLHTAQRFEIVSGISTYLPDGNKQTAWRTDVHDYMPVQVGLGAAYDLLAPAIDDGDQPTLSVTASAVLGCWSGYVDRQGERPDNDYAWHNAVSVVLGVRHSLGHVQSFIDAQYVPTPVPLQTGRSNYVDNDRIGADGGFAYDFSVFDVHLRLGAQAQVQVLLDRYQAKRAGTGADLVRDEFPDDAVDTRGRAIPSAAGLQTNNPGWPGFSSRGLLLGGAVNLAVLL